MDEFARLVTDGDGFDVKDETDGHLLNLAMSLRSLLILSTFFASDTGSADVLLARSSHLFVLLLALDGLG